MREKFHLDFTIVDREETFKLQRELGVDRIPGPLPMIITSMDVFAPEDILASFRGATHSLSGHFDALLPWQMLIVDEVHNLAPANYGDDSDRCEMLAVFPRFLNIASSSGDSAQWLYVFSLACWNCWTRYVFSKRPI